jgi:hypothetical protein
MGRGRAKAIQKKIARDLKYSSAGTDLERLRAELAASEAGGATAASDDEDEDELVDPFADDEDDDE